MTLWRGTFPAFQDPVFGAAYARYTGRRLVQIDGVVGFLGSKTGFGATTLYVYDPPNDDAVLLEALCTSARHEKAARLWTCSPKKVGDENDDLRVLSTLVVDINRPVEALWKHVGAKTRNMIRRGEREGVEIACCDNDSSLNEWWGVYRKTAQIKGFGVQSQELVRTVLNQGIGQLFLGKNNGRVVGGMVMLTIGYPVYWLGATDPEVGRYTSHLMMWEAISAFKSKGYEIMDLGGIEASNNHGPTRFKRAFSDDVRTEVVRRVAIRRWKSQVLDATERLQRVIRQGVGARRKAGIG